MKTETPIRNKPESESNDVILSTEERYLLDVLRAFLNDLELPKPPEKLDEKRFADLAVGQRVVGIVFDELSKRSEYFSSRLMDFLERLYAKEVVLAQYFQESVAKVEAEFEKNEIRYLPLKGAIMKELYPQNYHRSASDYDVIIDKNNIFRVASILKEKYDYEESSISPQHVCLTNKSGLTTIELHYVFWGRFDKPVFDDPWSRAVPTADVASKKSFKYRFTTEDFYLCVLLHLARHWLYDAASIRMFVDVWLFNQKYGERFDRASLDEQLRNDGVLEFAQNVERAARVWFGGLESDKTTEAMASRIFNPSKNRLLSGLDPFARKKNRLRRFIDNIFCSYYFESHAIEIERLPIGTRFLWKLGIWSKLTLERVKRGGVLRKIRASWVNNAVDVSEKRRVEERRFGLEEVRRLN